MTLTAVVAVSSNGVIGRDNGMPWHLPEDLQHFKALTMGRTLLMGRRTFDSIGRPLPGRTTVVLTGQPDWTHAGVTVVHSLDDARAAVAGLDAVVAGGGELYRALWADLDRLEVTHVHREVQGDTAFPAIDPKVWSETSRQDRDGFSFVGYRRRENQDEPRPGSAT